MLVLPTKGFNRSINEHNGRLDCMVDWIEGCVTFDEEMISVSAIWDMLDEGELYDDQDFAKEWIDDAFLELSRRQQCLGNVCPFLVNGQNIKRVKGWKETPAYAFCLMLSLQVLYRENFTNQFGQDYLEQGALFERLTTESLAKIGWRTHSTAWSNQAADSIRDKIEALAIHIGEPSGEGALERWGTDHAKDGGLDVVCHVPFMDAWSGRPLYFVQCASGEGWKSKRSSPNIALWKKLLDLSTSPRRGISIPFALLKDDFRKDANYDQLSLLMDRHRVCAPVEGLAAAWMSAELATALNQWTESRLVVLGTLKAD